MECDIPLIRLNYGRVTEPGRESLQKQRDVLQLLLQLPTEEIENLVVPQRQRATALACKTHCHVHSCPKLTNQAVALLL